MINFGKIAYDAYSESTGGVSLVSGAKLPEWSELKPEIKRAWEIAADAVRRASDLRAAADAAVTWSDDIQKTPEEGSGEQDGGSA